MNVRSYFLGIMLTISVVHPVLAFKKEKLLTRDEIQEARVSAGNALLASFISPRHRYMAWISDGGLMIAHEPGFVPEVLVSGGNKGGAVRRFFPSPDGERIIYVQDQKESSSEQNLMLLNVYQKNDKPELIKTIDNLPSGLEWAPHGQAVAFVEGKEILELRATKGGSWEIHSLINTKDPQHAAAERISGDVGGGVSDVAYSPNGLMIAFVSERKAGQSYIGIHDVTTGNTSYIHPSPFYDVRPVWSPDGDELAFIRVPINPAKDFRFAPERSREGGAPWSIQVANLKTGAIRMAWQASPGAGSIPNGWRLVWTASNQILFLWEKTGWNQLYAVSAAGGSARLLTPGDGEVIGFSSNSISADGHTVVYASNVGDPMRYHIWSVPVQGGNAIQLTSGQGSEIGTRGFSPGGYISYLAGETDKRQPRVVIRNRNGEERTLDLTPTEVVKRTQAVWDRLLPVNTIVVRAEDGVVSHHVTITPRGPAPAGGYPVIVNAHGGPTEQTKPYGGYAYAFGQYVAQQGYLFVDINYRGSTGFGLNYRLPEGRGATGGSEVKDVAAVVKYLKERKDVNPKRMGIMGASYGGHIVGLAMSRLPGAFAAGVSQFGVADWVLEMKKDNAVEGGMEEPIYYRRLSERLGIEDLAYASSPQIESWRGPVLLTIGDLDTQGHMESVQDLGYRLLQQGVHVEFYVDPAGRHNVFAWDKVFEFFERTLVNEN